MSEDFQPVVHLSDLPVETDLGGDHWGGHWQVLTPHMRDAGGKLGVVLNRMPPGRVGCPFHTHQLEDEVFYILEGTGTFRYGDRVYAVEAGHSLSCPAGTGVAHQLANTGTTDLVYLAIGNREPREVCTYPDSGKVMVRSLGTVGRLEKTPYMGGESDHPAILDMKPTEPVRSVE